MHLLTKHFKNRIKPQLVCMNRFVHFLLRTKERLQSALRQGSDVNRVEYPAFLQAALNCI